jgi:hypothetical protein
MLPAALRELKITCANAADWAECAKRGAALGGSPRQAERQSNRPKLPVPEGFLKNASRDLLTDKLFSETGHVAPAIRLRAWRPFDH